MRWIIYILLVCSFYDSSAQLWQVKNHPNNRRIAIEVNNTKTSEYVYSEVSELSEGKAYVAQGDLYAYIDQDFNDLTPYVFVEANNFKNGYAVVGDSFGRSLLNDRMQLIIPFAFAQVRPPVNGLIAVESHEGFWGVYNLVGDLKLPLVYDLPPIILSREKIIVRDRLLYGVVNDCNETVFNTNYQFITKDGYAYQKGKYLRLFKD